MKMLRVSETAYAVILNQKHRMEERLNRSVSMTEATDHVIQGRFSDDAGSGAWSLPLKMIDPKDHPERDSPYTQLLAAIQYRQSAQHDSRSDDE